MHKPQLQVKTFCAAMGQPAPLKFNLGSYPWELRKNLILEEAKEFAQATDSHDLTAMIDALCDLLYVTYGAAVAMGIDLEPFFEEVHRSNMTKLGPNGKPIYREDGKVLKPDTYSPPRINLILRNLTGTI